VPEPEWDNAYVSWALARQFHLGSIDLADEAAALEFADNRLRTFPFMNYDLRPDIRMKLLEMIEIYDAFKLNYPDYVDLVERMNAADRAGPYAFGNHWSSLRNGVSGCIWLCQSDRSRMGAVFWGFLGWVCISQ